MAVTALQPREQMGAELAEKLFIGGDLKQLSAAERLSYYQRLCESLHLNPLTRPLQYMNLSGKLTLYATKDAAEQIRNRNDVSIVRIEKEIVGDQYVVTAYARDARGREDVDMGAAAIEDKRGDELTNAMLKAVTKAKRRVTLSICGLGFLDETEIETIRNARKVRVDEDGVIHDDDEPQRIAARSEPAHPYEEEPPPIADERPVRPQHTSTIGSTRGGANTGTAAPAALTVSDEDGTVIAIPSVSRQHGISKLAQVNEYLVDKGFKGGTKREIADELENTFTVRISGNVADAYPSALYDIAVCLMSRSEDVIQ